MTDLFTWLARRLKTIAKWFFPTRGDVRYHIDPVAGDHWDDDVKSRDFIVGAWILRWRCLRDGRPFARYNRAIHEQSEEIHEQ